MTTVRVFVLVCVLGFNCYAQKKLDITFGTRFSKDTCKVTVYNNTNWGTSKDTICFTRIVTTSLETGKAETISIKYPKSNKQTIIEIQINGELRGVYSFDDIADNSLLVIDYARDIALRDLKLYKNSEDPEDKKYVKQIEELISKRDAFYKAQQERLEYRLYQKQRPKSRM